MLNDIFKTLALKKDSFFEVIFKLVIFYNSLPGIPGIVGSEPLVPLRSLERKRHLSPLILRLACVLKFSDYYCQHLFEPSA